MSSLSYYEVLGLDIGADAQAIKAAYRKLAFEFHPDRNDSAEAADQFNAIRNAYEALIDPIRRTAYDELQRVRKQQQAQAKQREGPSAQPTQSPSQAPQPKAPSRASPDDLVRLSGLLTRGRLAEAERMARKMIGQSANHPLPYAILGDIAKMRGDLLYASEMYAFAVQLDGRNLIYQRKHEEVAGRLAKGVRHISTFKPTQSDDNGSLLVAGLAVLIGCIAVVMGTEPPVAPDMPMIGSWTATLLIVLVLTGLALGACLSLGGMLSRFSDLISQVGDHSNPGALISVLSLLNFWLGAIFHCVIGVSRRRFDLTMSRIMGGTSLITLLLAGASAAQGHIDFIETLLWGGNVVFAGAIFGWLASDAYLEEAGRLK